MPKKHKPKWVHHTKRWDIWIKTTCGRVVHHERILTTTDINKTTCPRCKERHNDRLA